MNRCIIHIGMHKTGSTSIQHSLQNFDDGQFHYAVLGSNPNHSLAVYSLFAAAPGAHRLHASRRSGTDLKDYLAGTWKDLERSITAARGRTLLISGEGIVGLKPAELLTMAEFFRSRFDSVTIVGYVRPPAAFMASGFQQRVQGGALSVLNLERIYRNYRTSFGKFDAAFGRENVLLWKFDPVRFPDNDVVKDFCARLNISLPARRIVRVNEALPRQVIALLYTYHKFCKTLGVPKMNEAVTRKLAGLLKDMGSDKFRFSPEIVQPILDQNRDDIEWMEKRLGESLAENLQEQPGDIGHERDLLKPDPSVAAKLLQLLGDAAPKNVTGRTSKEIAQLVHALRTRQKPGRLARWLNRGGAEADTAENGVEPFDPIAAIEQKNPDLLNGLDRDQVRELTATIFAAVNDALAQAKDGTVSIEGLGDFRIKTVEAPAGKPARTRIVFHPNHS